MRIASAEDLGLFIRDFRQTKRLSQSDLARVAGVSRRWLANLETGKSTVEIGLVLKTLGALDLALDVQLASDVKTEVDLDSVLGSLGKRDG